MADDQVTQARAPTAIGDDARPIVVVGAHGQSLVLHVDSIPRDGETVMGHGYEETADGGKATNQAVAAARLGAPVRFVSLVGDDARGRRILSYLDEVGVDRRAVGVAAAPTDVGFVMLLPSGIPAIASAGDLGARLDRSFVLAAGDAVSGASVVICQLEAPAACAQAAFELARRVGARTVLNPAPAAPLATELLELTDVLVPNQHEAATITGFDEPPDRLARRIRDSVPWTEVVVTAGADGAYYCGREGAAHLAAPAVAAVDTTGAGDGFVGALAVRLRAGDSVLSAAGFAVVAAAISVTRRGTLDAYADMTETSDRLAGLGGLRGLAAERATQASTMDGRSP